MFCSWDYPEAFAKLNCCGLLLFPIYALLIYIHLSDRAKLEENLQKIENFQILNRCSDPYTHVDDQMISTELTKALQSKQLLFLWLKVCASLFVLNLLLMCSVPVSEALKE